MPITSISAFWYPVDRWERAKAFYSGALGLRLDQCDDEAGYAAYFIDDSSPLLFLVRRPELVANEESRGGVVTFDVTNVEPLLEAVVAFGGEVDEEIQEGEGVQIFTIYDPDGNVLELSQTI
jgi:predicted enzyme related to lactoylglutathione lyase